MFGHSNLFPSPPLPAKLPWIRKLPRDVQQPTWLRMTVNRMPPEDVFPVVGVLETIIQPRNRVTRGIFRQEQRPKTEEGKFQCRY